MNSPKTKTHCLNIPVTLLAYKTKIDFELN